MTSNYNPFTSQISNAPYERLTESLFKQPEELFRGTITPAGRTAPANTTIRVIHESR